MAQSSIALHRAVLNMLPLTVQCSNHIVLAISDFIWPQLFMGVPLKTAAKLGVTV